MTDNETVRLSLLWNISLNLVTLNGTITKLRNDIELCKLDPNTWPPGIQPVNSQLHSIQQLLSRYHNIVDLRRMPNDHGDAAVRRALIKVGFRYIAGSVHNGWRESYTRGHQQTIDLAYPLTDNQENLALENFRVTYHGAHYGDALWTLINPTAGEVLNKLGLELPFE